MLHGGGGGAPHAAPAVIVHLYVSGEMVSDIIQHHDVRDKKGNPILSARNCRQCTAVRRYAHGIGPAETGRPDRG